MKFGVSSSAKGSSSSSSKTSVSSSESTVKSSSDSNPGKTETPELPKLKSKFAEAIRKGAATVTTETVHAKKSDSVPLIAQPREVQVLDKPKGQAIILENEDIVRAIEEINALEENLETFEITGINISLFDIESLVRDKLIPEITNTDSKGKGSLNDPLMGVVENNALCARCGQNNVQCPGHFGYIKLNSPIYHPLFGTYLAKVLSSVCVTCGNLYFTEEQLQEKNILQYTGEKRLTILAEESASQMCRNCQDCDDKTKGCPGSHIPFLWNKDCMQIQAVLDEDASIKNINLEPPMRCETEEKSKKIKGRTVSILDVRKILRGLKKEAIEGLGFYHGAHPQNFILEYFPILPPIDRQPKFIPEGRIKEDNFTEQYKAIISKNLAVAGAKKDTKAAAIRALYDEIDKLIQGSDAGKKSKENLKSIKERIQGKEGRFRENMMGKRVNFSARTVIGPKPSLRFGQIAVPRVWAKQLRIKVTVCSTNRESLQNLFENGKIHFIFPSQGKYKGTGGVFVTDKWRKSYRLINGDEVERELMDGDYTIFNRQPTLHKQSMMGYQVVLHDELTLGLHITVTRPHNADFDGDESNLNQGSSYNSIAEMMNVMNVTDCVMNSQTNRPIMSLHFDSVTGVYLLTDDKTMLPKSDFYQLLMAVTRPVDLQRLERLGKEYGLITTDETGQILYSGKLLFSATLPEDFSFDLEKKGDKGVGDKSVVIRDGILVKGQLTSELTGAGHNSLIQALYKNYSRFKAFTGREGETEITKFITDATFLADQFLAYRGFSVGVESCLLPESERQNQENLIEEAFMEALRASYLLSKKVENPLEEERREAQIRRHLDTVKAIGGKIAKQLPETNALLQMMYSGAKGSAANLAQITTLLGQQFLKGSRFPFAITDNTRCLPYFEPDSLDVRSRGFCLNSFVTGLTPSELFFSQASGRIGLMDTALKTADVGDMHRRMVKILEDIKTCYDGTVRNTKNRIFQFVYGEDGMDAKELQFVKSPGGDIPMFVDVFKEARKINSKYENYQ
jgi:DNA-directed RNA polymerase beta' subunit